jgi:hypothetical protein
MTRKKRNILIILVIVVALVAIIALVAINNKDQDYSEGDYKYSILEDGTVEITEYLGSETEIDIPSELGGMPVSKLGNVNCFYNIRFNENTTVNIPNTVTTIGENTFAGLNGLTITGCKNLEKIEPYAFSRCTFAEAGSFPLCNNLKEIGYEAFCSSKNIGEIKFGENLERIGAKAFYSTDCIIDNIPDSVKYIGIAALGNDYYKHNNSDEDYTIVGDNVLISFNGSYSDTIIVPYGVKMIGIQTRTVRLWYADDFYIPDTVTAIEQDMFEVYHDVRIYIPSSVTSIGYGYDDDGKNGEIIYDIEYATLVVESGSYAESYAKKMNIKYEVVDSVQALYEAAVASESGHKN